ncbi:hypothetical protein EHS25_002000 [Saitozyma podzolica]|uniref:Uncharacterized protein n=1 Tax=Saitozyma podzolica TaxID=1890683 RepID=A0A427YE62_9TREE|nr:hypothetical protein EHS25_002000 [Saitozyma podzolica]
MSSVPSRSSSADYTSVATSLASPTEDAEPSATYDPFHSASADYTSVASSLASLTESAQPSAPYDPSRSASADHKTVASSMASLTEPQSSGSIPYAPVVSKVEDGEGIQFGQPVTVSFLKYRLENEILQDMTHCVSSIDNGWEPVQHS